VASVQDSKILYLNCIYNGDNNVAHATTAHALALWAIVQRTDELRQTITSDLGKRTRDCNSITGNAICNLDVQNGISL